MKHDPHYAAGTYGLNEFFGQIQHTLASMESTIRRDMLLDRRVSKRFSVTELAGLYAMDVGHLGKRLKALSEADESFPKGEKSGRERTYSLAEATLIRANLEARPDGRKGRYLHWRSPGEPLKVISFFSQKGGSGKSLSAAHLAQYLTMNYGMRVGVMDADPQATATLYFAADTEVLTNYEIRCLSDFMGCNGDTDYTIPSATELNDMWVDTPWPGIRLLPGNLDINGIDITVALNSRHSGRDPHFLLRDAIHRWDAGNPPVTEIGDLWDGNAFDYEGFEKASTETLDVIIIDQQPNVSIAQINGLLAATNVIVPQTMRGFDLFTLGKLANNVLGVLEGMDNLNHNAEHVGAGPHVILPTIVTGGNNDTDRRHILQIFNLAPSLIARAFYLRSDAVVNASEMFQSIYEYEPKKSKRASAKAFAKTANAVNDYIVKMIFPQLPDRGHSDEFVAEWWG